VWTKQTYCRPLGAVSPVRASPFTFLLIRIESLLLVSNFTLQRVCRCGSCKILFSFSTVPSTLIESDLAWKYSSSGYESVINQLYAITFTLTSAVTSLFITEVFPLVTKLKQPRRSGTRKTRPETSIARTRN
jgi:hypothetical protein